MAKTKFVPYGFVKLQKLPIYMWSELKDAVDEKEFIHYLVNNWDSVEMLLGSKDKYGIINKRHLNWASIRHIYGILTSKILRGGGSKLTTWSLWCKSNENGIKFKKIEGYKHLQLNIPNRTSFELSNQALFIGGDYYEQLKQSSVLIHNAVALNIKELTGSMENASLCDIDSALKRKLKSNPTITGCDASKLCGKVDYLLENIDGNVNLIPIDVNDLHGGLHWVDLFRDEYEKHFGSIVKMDCSIIENFCNSFIGHYHDKKGRLPERIVLCLDDYDRWSQDNGMNYIEMKNVAINLLNNQGIDASISLSYMSNYKESLTHYLGTNEIRIQVIHEDTGVIADKYMDDYQLVVRIYRKIQDVSSNEIFTTREILSGSPPFIIYDDEEIRPAYFKDNVHSVLGVLKDSIESNIIKMPSIIGVYNVSDINITERIIQDVITKGYNDFVLKLNEKTPYSDISALFFSAKNPLHRRILQDNIATIRTKIADVKQVIVEPLYGGKSSYHNKIEIRTINIASY
ncbi:MAG TPA: hypothetical protein ENG87_01640 [Candidatus Pacearchaeota archaeon]|nr:hypothetical protein [Candidatus Pacearchaeota archaeon]